MNMQTSPISREFRRFRAVSSSALFLVGLGLVVLLQSCAPSMRFSSKRAVYSIPSASTAVRSTRSPGIVLPTHPNQITQPSDETNFMEGMASFYGDEFQGRLTSNGEVFDQTLLTAAHRSLPFGTLLKVTNLRNGRAVTVRVNDRGPFAPGRILDLSRSAAERLDMVRDGVARVSIAVLN